MTYIYIEDSKWRHRGFAFGIVEGDGVVIHPKKRAIPSTRSEAEYAMTLWRHDRNHPEVERKQTEV